MRKLYEFNISVCGWGETLKEAQEACRENFDIDKEVLEDFTIIDIKDDDN